MLSLRPLPAFEDNYIWTLATGDGRAVVVDPGDAEVVLREMQAGLRPVAILVTHHHPDHIGGLERLMATGDLPCYAPDDARIPIATRRVGAGDTVVVEALDLSFDVFDVPGHTRSHIAFRADEWLFCGDTLFSLGCGRLFEGTPAQMLGSLDRLSALPDDTLVCCTHEYTEANGRFARAAEPDNPARDRYLEHVGGLRAAARPSLPSTVGIERACNPFLRTDEPGLRASIERHCGRKLDSRLEAFAELRAWKDGFRA
ncbi:hydroxyacylglutathione hydrolase [Arenimonas sp.]|uniref:hydroxyacylglutathione hydrolase n=1 Tax=Arenimonas sp. TaxID=1872635 RepID=UPI0039E3E865